MSKPSLGVSASPDTLIQFFYELNNNQKVREAFLADPLAVLDKAEIFVNPSSREEIVKIVKDLKKKYNDDLMSIPIEHKEYQWILQKDGVILLKGSTATGVP
jgi:hypothetical protein